MNNTLLMLRTELAKTQKVYMEDKIKATRLLNELSLCANPYFGDDIDLLKADEIVQIANELKEVREKLVENSKKIKELKRALDE